MRKLYNTDSIVGHMTFKKIFMTHFKRFVYLFVLIMDINCFSYVRMVGMDYRLSQYIRINSLIMRNIYSGNRNFCINSDSSTSEAVCVVLFLVNAEQEYSEVFQNNSRRKNFRFNFTRKRLDVFQREVFQFFRFEALILLYFLTESVRFIQYWV